MALFWKDPKLAVQSSSKLVELHKSRKQEDGRTKLVASYPKGLERGGGNFRRKQASDIRKKRPIQWQKRASDVKKKLTKIPHQQKNSDTKQS